MKYKVSPNFYWSSQTSKNYTGEEISILFDHLHPKKIVAEVSRKKVVKQGALVDAAYPEYWEKYNWSRAGALCLTALDDLPAKSIVCLDEDKTPQLSSLDFAALLKRRSLRFFSKAPISSQQLERVLTDVTKMLKRKVWIDAYVLIQKVDGYERGSYKIDKKTNRLIQTKAGLDKKKLLECLRGQWWVEGGGACLFFVISWKKLMSKRNDYSRGYIDMLLRLGEIGQEVVHSVYKEKLGCWMTPALHETLAAEILGTDTAAEEAMYFIKIGKPEENNGKSA